MKRAVYILLSVVMVISLSACGGSTSDKDKQIAELEAQVKELQSQLQEKTNSQSTLESYVESSSNGSTIINDKTGDNSSSNPASKTDYVDKAEMVSIGETITLDWAEITLETVEWLSDINPSDTSSVYSYRKGKDGEIYFVIWGTWKNTSGDSYSIENVVSQFIFNAKYKYSGYTMGEDDDGKGFYGDNVKPLKSRRMAIYVSVPLEVKEQFQNCQLTFGFDDNLTNSKYSTSLDKVNNLYMVDIK